MPYLDKWKIIVIWTSVAHNPERYVKPDTTHVPTRSHTDKHTNKQPMTTTTRAYFQTGYSWVYFSQSFPHLISFYDSGIFLTCDLWKSLCVIPSFRCEFPDSSKLSDAFLQNKFISLFQNDKGSFTGQIANPIKPVFDQIE